MTDGLRYQGVIDTAHGPIDLTGCPAVMAVLNVTPDSFSDGGEHVTADAIARRAEQIVADGADLVDVGGETTQPGSEPVTSAEQIRRVVPAIEAIRRISDRIPISVDTRVASVASAALDAGADVINDVSALRDDPSLATLAAERNVPIVLMHMLGQPKTMQANPTYQDVVAEVGRFLLDRVACAIAAGIARDRIIVDPGIGFGKTVDHNLTLMRGLATLVDMGHPVLLGPSRKRFIGRVLDIAEPQQRQWGTAATIAAGVLAGVHIVRVHDVAPMRQVAAMSWAIRQGRAEPRDSHHN